MNDDAKHEPMPATVSRRELRRLWARWRRLIGRIQRSKTGRAGISAWEYRRIHYELRVACTGLWEQSDRIEGRLYRKMMVIAGPWSELSSFQEADATILADLEARAAEIHWRLGGCSQRWRFVGLRQIAACLGLAATATGAWLATGTVEASGGLLAPAGTALRREAYRMWYSATYSLRDVNLLEISAVVVTIAIVVGLVTALRTRSF